MILDTGAKCSDSLFLGIFPFGIAEDYAELLNLSGYSGPIPVDAIETTKRFSGVLGDGTFYPAAAKLDHLSRLFWCVKSWTMNIKFTRSMFAQEVQCFNPFFNPLFAPIGPSFLSTFQYCIIGGYDGSPNNLSATDILVKQLSLQDYCSFYSAAYNTDKSGVCPIKSNLSNSNRNTCIPINPIQRFEDMLARNSYFTWGPTEEEITEFETGRVFTGFNGPYFDDWTQFMVINPIDPLILGYDCGIIPAIEKVKSYFTLSIMDLDGLAYSGLSKIYNGGYFPELYPESEVAPFDELGLSGEVLKNKWGEVTGYGINKKPFETWSPLVYDIGLGIPYSGFNAPENSSLYYPFIHFQMRFRNGAANNPKFCPMNETITSIYYQNQGLQKVGNLTIKDHLTNNTITGLAASTIISIPLYAKRTFQNCFVDVELRASNFWATGNVVANY